MKKLIILITLLVCFTGCMHLEKSYEDAVVNYEAYQEIYNAAKQINTNLCNMRVADAKDPMFAQFSKQQRILAEQANLNRQIADYNGKSRMLNRNIWKSSELPYQLSTNDFNCYQGETK